MPVAQTDFVPADIDTTQWAGIEPLIIDLRDRPVQSAADFETWLIDRSELDAACSEGQANLYIAMTCFTEDQPSQQAYTDYLEAVPPKLKPASFELDKRQVQLAESFPLDQARYGVLNRDTKAEVDLFREENVPIQTELAKLGQKYDQIIGAMTIQFDGEEKTLPQMGRYQESTDRTQREQAFKAVAKRRLQNADDINDTFDQMIHKRDTMAKNAGCPSYVQYAFRGMHRFDYTPEHCFAFHEACEKVVVPFLRKLDAKRADKLGVDTLRPWDLAVDVKGRAPLTPFRGGVELVTKAINTFDGLDNRLGSMLRELGDGATCRGAEDGSCYDLDSRKGKGPGGYQYMRDRIRKPFIFMNAAGLHRDVETMLHEAGHAFHSMLCIDEPLVHYRHSPIEFAEVASMSMELLTMPYWHSADGYYPDENEAARARRQQMEGSISLLPWIATIDAYQHWLYTYPNHTRDERTAFWLDLDARFGHSVSWEGLEDFHKNVWQRQGHLFGNPFYYIEYGIAQLGALQLWLRSLEEGEQTAISAYINGLSLGGAKPLPELFAASGIKFDFGPETVKRLVDRVEAELEKLPE